MFDIAHKSNRHGEARRIRQSPRHLALGSFALLILSFIGAGGAAANADVRNAPTTAVRLGVPFAIADFDGDRRPDLASVQSSPDSSSTANYRIQLKFSQAGRGSIQLLAPAGGLWIEARDVNGDDAVDLVLSTAWSRQPVAIFLNDGHGDFSRAETSAFPGAFNRDNRSWGSPPNQEAGAVGAPPQSRDSAWLKAGQLSGQLSSATPISVFASDFICVRFLISYAGRAPPSKVSL
jgi:hypothetical protein